MSSETTPDDATCPMHGAREPYAWDCSPREPGCTCPAMPPDETVGTDGAPFGYDQSHDPTPDDAARAAAARTYPDSYTTGRSEALAFIKGAAWQRVQFAARRDEVAKSLALIERPDESWDELAPWTRTMYRRLADAALAALGVSDQ